MARFRYTALGADGRRIRGVLDLPSARAAVDRIQSQGQLALRVEPDSFWNALRTALTSDVGGPRRLKARRVAEATRELSLLLRAGQSLDQALRFTIRLSSDKAAREVLTRIRDKVRNGSALATALAEEPNSFSKLYVGLVRAGEQSGALGDTLGQLGSFLDRQQALTAKIRSAMVYPVLLLLASIATLALMLLYVLPQFAPLFQDAGAELPGSMRVLLGLGDFVGAYGLAGLGVLVAGAAAFAAALRRPGFRRSFDLWLLRVPILGQLIVKIETARLTRTLGTLLQSGVALVQGLSICRAVVSNGAFLGMIDQAIGAVKEGARLCDLLDQRALLPLRTTHLLRLGEETGQLGAMALRAAEIQEVEVERSLEQMVSLIVPVMTIVMGLVVGGIISSIMSAMLSLNQLAG